MSCKLYANIGVSHGNDFNLLQNRLIAAAQCNADAVIINKSTPWLVVPDEKKYVSIETEWGSLPYVEAAKRSELTEENAAKLVALSKDVGIPLIWSVTDSTAAEFVRDFSEPDVIKLHYDTVDIYELSRFCKAHYKHVIFPLAHIDIYAPLYGKSKLQYTTYHTTADFPPKHPQMNFRIMDKYLNVGYNVGYEGREPGIFPALGLVYKNVSHIEKYLGEDDSDNPSILTPAQFYDLFNSMMLMDQSYDEIPESD